MKYAIYDTKLGKIRVEYDADTVTLLKKVADDTQDFGEKNDVTEEVYRQLIEYLDGKRKEFTFCYEMRGTEFQKKVWKALVDIPYGETRTYKEVATAVGNDKASRAVGLANNKNPINIVVPCHRVVGANGKLVGYAGGLDMKEVLLNLESENR